MAQPRYRKSRAHKKFTRTAGDLTLNSGSWADLPTIGTTFDITMRGQVGDDIEAGIIAYLGNEAFAVALDVVTIVGGAFQSSFASQSTGRPSVGAGPWRAPASAFGQVGGAMLYTLTSGDLASGLVTVRAQYSQPSAGAKTLYASTTTAPFHFYAKNLGPPKG